MKACLKQYKEVLEKESLGKLQFLFSLLTSTYVEGAKRKDVIDAILKTLSTDAENALRNLPEFELRKIRDLAMQGEGGVIFVHDVRELSVSVLLNFVEFKSIPRERHTVSFTPGMYEALAPYAGTAYAKSELDGEFLFDYFYYGSLSLYGCFYRKDFAEMLNDAFSHERDKLKGTLLSRGSRFPLMATFMTDDELLFFPSAADQISALRKNIDDSGFTERKPFSLQQIIETGKGMPACIPAKNTPEGKALFDTLVEMDFDNEMIPWIMTDFWETMEIEGPEAVEQAILEYIYPEDENDMDDAMELRKDEDQLRKVVKDYLSVVPLWLYGGRSLKETGKSFYSYHPIGKPSSSHELRSLPKIGMNDPCPCGSGLMYKNCHGKNLN